LNSAANRPSAQQPSAAEPGALPRCSARSRSPCYPAVFSPPNPLRPGGLDSGALVDKLAEARVVGVPGRLFSSRGLQVRSWPLPSAVTPQLPAIPSSAPPRPPALVPCERRPDGSAGVHLSRSPPAAGNPGVGRREAASWARTWGRRRRRRRRRRRFLRLSAGVVRGSAARGVCGGDAASGRGGAGGPRPQRAVRASLECLHGAGAGEGAAELKLNRRSIRGGGGVKGTAPRCSYCMNQNDRRGTRLRLTFMAGFRGDLSQCIEPDARPSAQLVGVRSWVGRLCSAVVSLIAVWRVLYVMVCVLLMLLFLSSSLHES
jgi:hypothetical protein